MRPGDVLRYPVESAEGRLPQCAESVRFRARILQTSVDVLVLCDHVKSFDWKRTARGSVFRSRKKSSRRHNSPAAFVGSSNSAASHKPQP